jgi:hypothetical protein
MIIVTLIFCIKKKICFKSNILENKNKLLDFLIFKNNFNNFK